MSVRASGVVSYLYESAHPPRAPQTLPAAIHRRACALAIRFVRLFSDPVVRTRIGRRRLYAPASHRASQFRAEHPYYDTALPRLAAFLHRGTGEVTLIDVGANIGDTVALVTDQTPARCLAVEGDEAFFRLLQLNTASIGGVVCEQAVVSNTGGTVQEGFLREGGTAHLARGAGRGATLTTTTVDSLAQRHPAFSRTNLLKVDTDGYDYKVLRGAEGLLRTARPALYFELSPWHLRAVADDDPRSIFAFLERLGYARVLFYDNLGYPLAAVSVREQDLIAQLLDYAARKRLFYFDIVTLQPAETFDEFVRSEWDAVPRFEWPRGRIT
jgi:FkbM family methyltransferase